MKIRTPVPEKKSRLEIIPLIDIMFFLLASFMMISLQMQIVRTVKANLPTATLATSSTKPDIVNLLVNRDGQVFVDQKAISFSDLNTLLTNRFSLNTNLPVYITGARDATHGSVIYVLDLVKRAGISHVAIAVKAAPTNHEKFPTKPPYRSHAGPLRSVRLSMAWADPPAQRDHDFERHGL